MYMHLKVSGASGCLPPTVLRRVQAYSSCAQGHARSMVSADGFD